MFDSTGEAMTIPAIYRHSATTPWAEELMASAWASEGKEWLPVS